MSDLLSRLFPAVPPAPRTPSAGTQGFATHPENIEGEGKSLSNTDDGLSTRWRAVLSFELKGWDQKDIATALNLTPNTIHNITHDDRYIAYREKYLAEMDSEFFAMKPLAFEALRSGLRSNDENTALRAAEQWFKGASFGGYSRREEANPGMTAEDVARSLLVQVNVQVNNNGQDDDR